MNPIMKSSQMIIPIPSKKGYTIYTKNGCAYCNLAKQLLHKYEPTIIDCNELYLDNKTEFFEKMQGYTKKIHKTFPLIFQDGRFIGGYIEINALLLLVPTATIHPSTVCLKK